MASSQDASPPAPFLTGSVPSLLALCQQLSTQRVTNGGRLKTQLSSVLGMNISFLSSVVVCIQNLLFVMPDDRANEQQYLFPWEWALNTILLACDIALSGYMKQERGIAPLHPPERPATRRVQQLTSLLCQCVDLLAPHATEAPLPPRLESIFVLARENASYFEHHGMSIFKAPRYTSSLRDTESGTEMLYRFQLSGLESPVEVGPSKTVHFQSPHPNTSSSTSPDGTLSAEGSKAPNGDSTSDGGSVQASGAATSVGQNSSAGSPPQPPWAGGRPTSPTSTTDRKAGPSSPLSYHPVGVASTPSSWPELSYVEDWQYEKVLTPGATPMGGLASIGSFTPGPYSQMTPGSGYGYGYGMGYGGYGYGSMPPRQWSGDSTKSPGGAMLPPSRRASADTRPYPPIPRGSKDSHWFTPAAGPSRLPFDSPRTGGKAISEESSSVDGEINSPNRERATENLSPRVSPPNSPLRSPRQAPAQSEVPNPGSFEDSALPKGFTPSPMPTPPSTGAGEGDESGGSSSVLTQTTRLVQ